MRIFLTGGTGFLGSYFLQMALNAGHEVVALRLPGERCKQKLPCEPVWIDGTLEDFPRTSLGGVETLVHLAAHGVNPTAANWRDCFRWNVSASLALWLDAAGSNVRRFVIAGSCFEYGNSGEQYDFIPTDAPLLPTGPYHSSKAAATMAALGFAMDQDRELIILRPFHIYGDGEAETRFWPLLVKAAAEGRDLPMTEGTQIRDFTPVRDVAARFVHAMDRQDLCQGFPMIENVGSGQPRSLLQFATDEWIRLGATGKLLPGLVPIRSNEVMRYVPKIK
jgi:nucleoside-diphosphate-sugar epimerase